ncbi:MAG: MAPEG family protein [Halieaceae bacterium]|jgi:uncharacterized MAPEG superfamily protein|nr:MAPEG family protein [Halieaceae bacterium]
MSATESTILLLVLWWAVLLFQLPVIRLIASKSTGSMSFDPNGSDLEGYGRRLTRAAANCSESIPMFIIVMLVAIVTDNSDITNATATWLLFARVAQSVAHLISVSTPLVMARFFFFLVQVGLALCWIVQMLMA